MVPHALNRAHRRTISTGLLFSLLTLALGVSSACDKVPLLAPAGTVITLVSTTTVLPINGETDIVAVLIENGTTSTGTGQATTTASTGTPVHNGTVVSFTTSLGKIEPAEARTTNGRVTVKLTADGRSGRAVVTAFSGSASKTLEVVIGAAAAERVLVTASPTVVPAVGGTSSITARVEDASGNALRGVPVAFTTTAGTLSAVSALTGDAGTASVSLSTTLAATVTATAGGKSGTAAITVRTASTVSLTVPSSITVGAPVNFVVTPSAGATLSNVVINFGDGRAPQNLGTLSSASSVAYVFEDEDIFLIRVTATDSDGSPVSASSSVAVGGFQIGATASPASGPLGTVVSFTVTGLPTGVSLADVHWNFGNGVTRTTQSLTTTYEFPQRGAWVVVITLRPTFGPSRTTTVNVNVN